MRFTKDRIDWYLMISVIALSFWSVFHLYTLSGEQFYYFNRQLIWVLSGTFLLFLFSLVPSSFLSKLTPLAYLLIIVLLVVVFTKGEIAYGARRWLRIGGIEFQPSEFAKIVLILSLAKLLGERRYIGWKMIFFSLVLTLPFSILTAVQPDLGTALIFVCLWLIILFISGVSLLKFLTLIGTISAFFPFLYFFLLQPYQKMRVLTFLNPQRDPMGTGWSTLQSKIALGSGCIFGKGIGEAVHTQLKYLPQPFTDFIFSSIGEEWGFIGSLMVIAVYSIVVTRGILIALKKGKSFTGLFAVGFTSLIALQAFVNIGMVSGILPVVGIPLPFISYGGSSTFLFLSGVGILLSFNKEGD